MTDTVGRVLLSLGLVLVVVGIVIWVGGRLVPLGRLPGDILIRRGNTTLYFPLATGLVLSLILTLLVHLWQKLR